MLDIYIAAGIAGYNTGDISNTINAAVKSDEDKKNREQSNVKVGNGVKVPDPAKSNMVTNGGQFIHFGLSKPIVSITAAKEFLQKGSKV